MSVLVRRQANNPGAQSYFELMLMGTQVVVPAEQHQLQRVRVVTVLNPQREVVSVFWKVRESQEVLIVSNLPLDNHFLILS